MHAIFKKVEQRSQPFPNVKGRAYDRPSVAQCELTDFTSGLREAIYEAKPLSTTIMIKFDLLLRIL